MATIELLRSRPPSRVGLGWAFFERQTNLWKRYWAWEVVWLLYGVVNTLAITFIANEAGRSGTVSKGELSRLTMFLLIGTLVWAYMSAVLDDMSLTVMWERWEGTIEHTLDGAGAPGRAPGRDVRLGLLHAFMRTCLIMACSLPFFHIDLGRRRLVDGRRRGGDWAASAWSGLGILARILPLLYPERGEQMSFMVQALVLLVSGVYYSVDVLPGWLQVASHVSPATYLLRGIRDASLEREQRRQRGRASRSWPSSGGACAGSLAVFGVAERWAKKTGRLKRQG